MLQLQNNGNEFVFKRRRKRSRIDVQDAASVVQASAVVGLRSELISEIAVLPEPTASSPALPLSPELQILNPEVSSDNTVTVERFLRDSVQTDPRSRRVVIDGISLRKPYAYIRQHRAKRRTLSTRKVPKLPKGRSRIAKTLFRATVLTDGDPLDNLVDGAGISHTRRPLKFAPFNKFASPLKVDQANSVEPSDLNRKEGTVLHTRRLGITSDPKAHHHHSASSHPRMPLRLVPLREAEAAYSAMFP